METSGYQPVPNEPGGFAAMPVPVPEPEAPADQGWTYSFVAEPVDDSATEPVADPAPTSEPAPIAEPVPFAVQQPYDTLETPAALPYDTLESPASASFEVPPAAFEPAPVAAAAFEAPPLEPANGQVYDLSLIHI